MIVERPETPGDLRHITDDVSQCILGCIFHSFRTGSASDAQEQAGRRPGTVW